MIQDANPSCGILYDQSIFNSCRFMHTIKFWLVGDRLSSNSSPALYIPSSKDDKGEHADKASDTRDAPEHLISRLSPLHIDRANTRLLTGVKTCYKFERPPPKPLLSVITGQVVNEFKGVIPCWRTSISIHRNNAVADVHLKTLDRVTRPSQV